MIVCSRCQGLMDRVLSNHNEVSELQQEEFCELIHTIQAEYRCPECGYITFVAEEVEHLEERKIEDEENY